MIMMVTLTSAGNRRTLDKFRAGEEVHEDRRRTTPQERLRNRSSRDQTVTIQFPFIETPPPLRPDGVLDRILRPVTVDEGVMKKWRRRQQELETWVEAVGTDVASLRMMATVLNSTVDHMLII